MNTANYGPVRFGIADDAELWWCRRELGNYFLGWGGRLPQTTAGMPYGFQAAD